MDGSFFLEHFWNTRGPFCDVVGTIRFYYVLVVGRLCLLIDVLLGASKVFGSGQKHKNTLANHVFEKVASKSVYEHKYSSQKDLCFV